jgi:hypothetical protein
MSSIKEEPMKIRLWFTCLIIFLGCSLAFVWVISIPGLTISIQSVSAEGTDILYVRSDGNDGGDCTDSDNPCRTVQYAVDQAAPFDVVFVASGTYTDSAGTVVALDKTLTLQGGWSSDFLVHDRLLYPTTLNARRLGSVISITAQPGEPIAPTIDGFIITKGDASSQAIQGGGLHSVYADPIIVNNIISDNIANSVYYYTGDGGGLYLSQSPGIAVIRDNVFIRNTTAITGGWGQGGAIYSDYSSPIIVGNLITSNIANGFYATPDARSVGGNGGGVVVYNGMTATVIISGNQFYNNISSVGEHGTGGGIVLGDGTMLVQSNTLRGNIACSNGWGVGGGIYLSGGRNLISIKGNRIEKNTAGMGNDGSRGGGLFLEYIQGPSPVVIEENTILSNTASSGDWAIGGGVYVGNSPGQIRLTHNRIEGNLATTAPDPAAGGGGGIGSENNSALYIRDNAIRNNTAALYGWGEGGGYYARNEFGLHLENNLIEDNTGALDNFAYGGGLYLESSPAIMLHNTIQNNRVSNIDGYGGGIFVYYSAAKIDSNKFLSNTAAINPTGNGVGWGGGVMIFASTGVSVTNNFIANNQDAGVGTGQGAGIWMGGSTTGEPMVGTLLHNTVANNDGEGIYMRFYTNLVLKNNIIAGHLVAITSTYPMSATLFVDHTLFWNNGSLLISGTNAIIGNPLFANPAAGDYHILPGSAAINAGITAGVTSDIDGDPRSLIHPAIGADELTQKTFLPLMLKR